MRYILNNSKLTKNENTIFLTDEECEKELLSELVFLSKKVTDFRNKFLDKKQARLALASFGGQYQVSYFDIKTDNISKFKKMVNKLIPVFKETEIKEYKCMSSIGISTLGKLATIAPPNSLKEELITNLGFLNIIDQEELEDYEVGELKTIRKFRLVYLLYCLVYRGVFKQEDPGYTLGHLLGLENLFDVEKFSGKNKLLVFIDDLKDNVVKISFSFVPRYWINPGLKSGVNRVGYENARFKIVLSEYNSNEALFIHQLNNDCKSAIGEYVTLDKDIRNFNLDDGVDYIECVEKDELVFIKVNDYSSPKLYTLVMGKFKAEEIIVNKFIQTKITSLDVENPSEIILNCKISELPFLK